MQASCEKAGRLTRALSRPFAPFQPFGPGATSHGEPAGKLPALPLRRIGLTLTAPQFVLTLIRRVAHDAPAHGPESAADGGAFQAPAALVPNNAAYRGAKHTAADRTALGVIRAVSLSTATQSRGHCCSTQEKKGLEFHRDNLRRFTAFCYSKGDFPMLSFPS